MKKGFTLIELMAVIVIIAMLALIITPNALNAISKYRNRLYDTQLDNIRSAAKHWAADKIDERLCLICVADPEYTTSKDCANLGGEGCIEASKGSNASVSVKLSELISGGYLQDDVENPKTNKPFASCVNVVITINSKTGEYEYNISNPDVLESSC